MLSSQFYTFGCQFSRFTFIDLGIRNLKLQSLENLSSCVIE